MNLSETRPIVEAVETIQSTGYSLEEWLLSIAMAVAAIVYMVLFTKNSELGGKGAEMAIAIAIAMTVCPAVVVHTVAGSLVGAIVVYLLVLIGFAVWMANYHRPRYA